MTSKTSAAPQFGGRGWRGTRSRLLDVPIDDTRSLVWVLIGARKQLAFKPRHFFSQSAFESVQFGPAFFVFDDRVQSQEAVGPRAFNFWMLHEAVRQSDCVWILSRRMNELSIYRAGRAIPEQGSVTIIATTKEFGGEWSNALALCRMKPGATVLRFLDEPSERALARARRLGRAVG